jgi:hypothetical protein
LKRAKMPAKTVTFALPPTLVVLVALLATSPARADTVAVGVLDAAGVSDSAVRKVVRVLEQTWQQESAWTLVPSVPRAKAILAPCGDSDSLCLMSRAQTLGTDHVLLVQLSMVGKGLWVKAHLVDGARASIVSKRIQDVRPDDPEAALGAFAAGMIPPQAKRGYGALWVEAEKGAVLKLNGRKQTLSSPELELAVPAGPHETDVAWPSGDSVLQRLTVDEGSRVHLAYSEKPFQSMKDAGPRPLRLAAYGLWSGAGVAFAASLLAGALSNHALKARGEACVGDDRTCPNIDSALREQHSAEVYARNANIFAGLGVALALGGGVAFTVDWLGGRK